MEPQNAETMRLPEHIAFIMDGNGRWAKKRGLPRSAGHREGAKTLKNLIGSLEKLGIKYATFYAFSTENWKRPKDEVSALMRLFEENLDDLINYQNENVCLRFIGRKERLSETLLKKMSDAEKESSDRSGLNVTLAIDYGGRDEIVRACLNAVKLYQSGALNLSDITEDLFGSLLYTKDYPDVDLLIRTGGESRISNFLLWQISYAELYFTDTLWCDFDEKELKKAISDFASRDRRYGDVK